jgi:phenylacetic acid degradation operon negative regulatory protein
MATSGEVVADDGRYGLGAPRLVERQARQGASRAARTRPWRGGRWRMVVLGAGGARSRDDRAAARDALIAARLAELREGVWLRPDNVAVPAVAGGRTFLVVPDDDAGALASSLWDLDGWAAEAGALRAGLAELLGPLEAGDTDVLRDGFVLSAAVLRQFLHDPLLPGALLPPDWPGAALRADYDRYDTAYRFLLREWFRD